jgi:hypothetical protein
MLDEDLWGGITISSSRDDVQSLFPECWGESPLYLGYFRICGGEFLASWGYWRSKEPKVTLACGEFKSDRIMQDVTHDLISALTTKYGRGKARIEHNGVLRKVWDRRLSRVQLTSIQDEMMPTITVEYFRPLYLGDNIWASEVFPDISKI